MTKLKDLIGGHIVNAAPTDITIRIHIINVLVTLLSDDEIEPDDIEDCLDDFMEENFSVIPDESSHREIANVLFRVRKELAFCAMNDLDLPSGSETLMRLIEFNKKNQGQVIELSKYMQANK